ncbi:MAG TPA: ABC transporter substrate-binding protein [Xanthobacteraceae bacterium]|jgi:NitT/TauT family transport system substrate-binding protein|nr:ABC transporter substrate-binding protein [Xanthobacteraceae bacterium]
MRNWIARQEFRMRAGMIMLAAMAAPAAAAEPIEIKAGIADPVNTVLAWWTAQDAGFFAAQGLKVEIVNMNGGSRGAEALKAGALDVMHVGLSSVVKLNHAGDDLRLIGSLSNVIRFTFFSAPGIATAADLKGGVIGVSTFGSESDTTATLALARLGLNRGDVVLKEYGGGPQRLAAVKSGEIKATPLNEPFTSLAREQGVNVMVDLVPEQIPWLFSGITVRREEIATRRDALTRFFRASVEGNYLALSDEARAKAILAKELKISDPKIVDISYNDFKQQSPPDLEPSRQGAENILAQFPGGSRSVDDYVDAGIFDELKAAGFFAQMQRKYGKR